MIKRKDLELFIITTTPLPFKANLKKACLMERAPLLQAIAN
jgi:hypothetical protein